jgi:hypothetical protein
MTEPFMKPLFYRIHPDHSITVTDNEDWCRQLEAIDERVVALTADGDIRVSTVFLGLDHGMLDPGPPILFETLVFGGKLEGEGSRYATWDEAIEGHKVWVRHVVEAERNNETDSNNETTERPGT